METRSTNVRFLGLNPFTSVVLRHLSRSAATQSCITSITLRFVCFEKIGQHVDKILVLKQAQYRGRIIALGGMRLGL